MNPTLTREEITKLRQLWDDRFKSLPHGAKAVDALKFAAPALLNAAEAWRVGLEVLCELQVEHDNFQKALEQIAWECTEGPFGLPKSCKIARAALEKK